MGDHALQRLHPGAPRSHRIPNFADWYAACHWVVDSGKIPVEAQFLLPRDAQTFKWYTGRRDVVTWKDVPQDAKSLRQWWDMIQDIYATDFPEGPRWYEPLTAVGTKRIKRTGREVPRRLHPQRTNRSAAERRRQLDRTRAETRCGL